MKNITHKHLMKWGTLVCRLYGAQPRYSSKFSKYTSYMQARDAIAALDPWSVSLD